MGGLSRRAIILITFIRSSSYGAYDWCETKYMFEWVLGWRCASQSKADKGSAVHKALELLAGKKLALQEGRTSFANEELGRDFSVEEMDPELAIKLGYEHYRPSHSWTDKDWSDCRRWMYVVLEHNDGMFNPLNRDIVAPELYFDYEIREPWARYDYALPDGSRLAGNLAVKGTVDLVTRVSNDTMEYVDFKTGQRKNWKTGKKKEVADFKEDPQLRIYHHALSRTFPGHHIIITIFFTEEGGPFSVCFGPRDLKKTEEILRKRFEEIKANVRPSYITKQADLWKCSKVPCEFHVKKWEGTGRSVCEFMRGELASLGMDRLVAKYADLSRLKDYGSGGGRS